jgi:nitroreductase
VLVLSNEVTPDPRPDMDLVEALYTTRAMRRVKPDPIADDVVASIVDAAIRAPSGGNQQRFRFLTVTDAATKEILAGWYRESLGELNRSQYASVMELIEHGDSADPAVIQSKKTLASAQWNLPLLRTSLPH